jgi:hypothetical protein
MQDLILNYIDYTNNIHIVNVSIPIYVNFTTVINIKNINIITYFVNRLIMFDHANKNLQLSSVHKQNEYIMFVYEDNHLKFYIDDKTYYINKSSAIKEFKSLLKKINSNNKSINDYQNNDTEINKINTNPKINQINTNPKINQINTNPKINQIETVIKIPNELNI